MKPSIRSANHSDSEQIVEIYNYYVVNSAITFEEEAVSSENMSTRIKQVKEDNLPWLVAECNNQILGYAYASKWKGRCAYRYSVESTVYLDHTLKSKGVGSSLYSKLLSELKLKCIHTVMGGIALPNEASIGLHEKYGFEKVAHFREVGYKFNKWVDVAYWQLKLND